MSWDDATEGLLLSWGAKAQLMVWIHNKSSQRYTSIADAFSLSIQCTNLTVSITSFISSAVALDETWVTIIMIILGIANIIAAALATVHKEAGPEGLAKSHNHHARLCASFARRVSMTISLPRSERQETSVLQAFQVEYEDIISHAPFISSTIIAQFHQTFSESEFVPDIIIDRVDIRSRKQYGSSLSFAHGFSGYSKLDEDTDMLKPTSPMDDTPCVARSNTSTS